MTDLRKKLDALADAIADKATKLLNIKPGDKSKKDETPLQESIDAFKALTTYYSATHKQKKKAEDGDGEEDFSDIITSTQEPPNGEISSRRARN